MNDELEKLKGDVKLPLRVIIKRTLKYISSEKGGFILSLLLLGLNVVLDSISPLFTSRITDELVQDNINIKLILNLVLLSFALTCIDQAFLYLNARTLQNSGQRIIYRLRREIFEHIENMSQNQFNIMPVGSLVTRVANYTTSMSDLFTNVLVSLLRNALTIIGVYGIMFYLSWKLSLLLFAFVAVVFIASFIFRKVITKIWRKERRLTSDLNTFLNENLSGMKIIQIFNQQKRKEKEFNVKNTDLRKTKFKAVLA
ncbi:MAG: ABC transporter ATP-binding protein, partial [Erysipelotrichaceae bacterium]|nr:ABC transporter ATP-binding protein [Erysipelotrichaceae bacterium]